eukprot:scaffold83301_cov51-Phaeocystis_antarctica.AAC.2
MSLSSLFCWVPRGQGQGDPTRHMVAICPKPSPNPNPNPNPDPNPNPTQVSIYHGCLPVFSLGETAEQDDALPFDEVLDWGRFS